jgi:ABC-type enterochelin transport system permease subunit
VQILYAAPFLLIAAFAFSICALVRPLRKFAVSVPVGTLTFGVGALLSFVIFVLVMNHLHMHESKWVALVPSICGGLVVGIISARITHSVLMFIPAILLRIGVCFSALCSSATIACAFLLWSSTWHSSAIQNWPTGTLVLYYSLSCIPITIAAGKYSENFRPPYSRVSANRD